MQNPSLSQEQAGDLRSTWDQRIVGAVGDPERWREVGGGEYDFVYTPDPSIHVVITRPQGHDAIRKLPGIVDITPPR